MRKRTTTLQIQNVIKNNLLILERAEIHYKTSGKTETIDAAKFKEYFTKFCESGIFADVIRWHYEKNHITGEYIIETGRMNPHSEVIVIMYLHVCDGVSGEELEKALLFSEEE